MAVVTFFEPDDKVRDRYFECEGDCRPWVVPAGPGDLAAAAEIGYKPYKISRCPEHSIWASTRMLLAYPVFISALRHRDLPLTTGGVLQQPASMGALIHHARKEHEAFQALVSERRKKN